MRKYEEGFSTKEFAQTALDIIVEAQELLNEYVVLCCPVWVDEQVCVSGEKENKVWTVGKY